MAGEGTEVAVAAAVLMIPVSDCVAAVIDAAERQSEDSPTAAAGTAGHSSSFNKQEFCPLFDAKAESSRIFRNALIVSAITTPFFVVKLDKQII